jgi:protease-4
MFTLLSAVSLLALTAAPADLVTLPTDVTAYSRGAAAVGIDPAAAGRLDGAELQLRHLSRASDDPTAAGSAGLGAWALYGAVPLMRLTLFGGYEWAQLPQPHAGRSTVGLGAKITDWAFAGLSYHALCPLGCTQSTGVWDMGLLLEPSRYLSVSLGVDSLNAASGPNAYVPRAGRLGIAVRPLAAQPLLTLAADTRVSGGYRTPWGLDDSRAVADLMPIEGLHVTATYARRSGRNLYWAGLGVDLLGLELFGALRAGESSSAALQGATAITGKIAPQRSIYWPHQASVEVALQGDLLGSDGGFLQPAKRISTVALQLDALADNPDIGRVVLSIGQLRTGLAVTDELRAAIARLQDHGVYVVADLRSADDKTYMVAAAANCLRLDPIAHLRVDGFATTHHFFAEALGHLRLRFDAVGIGRYKSGPDALTRNAPRPQDQEVQEAIMGQAQASLQQVLTDDRHLTPKQSAAVLQQGLFGGRAALAANLVDVLQPQIDVAAAPGPHSAALVRQPQGVPYAATVRPTQMWGAPPIVAVIPIVGTLVHATAGSLLGNSASDAALVAQLQEAQNNPQVAGVVLRIDSPGGDVEAAEAVWRAVRDLRRHKPVVASLADVAASGGYYIAAAAQPIFAQPNSLTGSIGIFTLRPDLSGFLEWIGVHGTAYTSTPHANWDSVEHGLAEADRSLVQSSLEDLYTDFVQRVAAGRGLSEARVRVLAEGRVYTGQQARTLGLVDAFGGLAEAVRSVREQAHLSPTDAVEIQVPDRQMSLGGVVEELTLGRLQRALGLFSGALDPARGLVSSAADALATAAALQGRPLALCPEAFAQALDAQVNQ